MDYIIVGLIVEVLAILGVVRVTLFSSPYHDDPGHF